MTQQATTPNITAIQDTLNAHRKEILVAVRNTPAEFHRTVCVEWDGAWCAISTPMTRGSAAAFVHDGQGFGLTLWGGKPFYSYEELDEAIGETIDALYLAEAGY